jgi:hypothetical protein
MGCPIIAIVRVTKREYMKILHQNMSAWGGYGYRAVTDNQTEQVKLQERYNNGRWRTVRIVSLATFDSWADAVNLYDAYNNDPALLGRFTNYEAN